MVSGTGLTELELPASAITKGTSRTATISFITHPNFLVLTTVRFRLSYHN